MILRPPKIVPPAPCTAGLTGPFVTPLLKPRIIKNNNNLNLYIVAQQLKMHKCATKTVQDTMKPEKAIHILYSKPGKGIKLDTLNIR